MSEAEDKNRNNADQLDHKSTEELEALLKAYSKSSENIDMEYVLSILEVIEKRESLYSSGKYTDIDTAWASFKKNYRPSDKEAKSLYDFEEVDDVQADLYTVRRRKRPIRHKALLRTACVLASVVIVLLSSNIVASAFGFDLWSFVAQWTKDTFVFSNVSSYEQASPVVQEYGAQNKYNSLQEALDNYSITVKLAPSWLPDGYILHDINVNETPMQTTIHSAYKHDDHEIIIVVTSLNKPSTRIYEKDSEDVIVYTFNEIEHYIMSNLDQTTIAWLTENYECSISGAFSVDEAKLIINSIYESDLNKD